MAEGVKISQNKDTKSNISIQYFEKIKGNERLGKRWGM